MLKHKMSEQECLLLNDDIDVIGISETCWKDGNQWDILIPGYQSYWNDKIRCARRVEVVVLCRKKV